MSTYYLTKVLNLNNLSKSEDVPYSYKTVIIHNKIKLNGLKLDNFVNLLICKIQIEKSSTFDPTLNIHSTRTYIVMTKIYT
jgi:hypothetical protein